jgi:glycosyltransferase involved in cell wall biosynthesis
MNDAPSKDLPAGLVLGIDASNLRDGGGRTHLIELLSHADPQAHGFSRVVVWGLRETLTLLPSPPWLVKRALPSRLEGRFGRLLWQYFSLKRGWKDSGCHQLFAPGGSAAGGLHPVVTMSQNMLPFDWTELKRFGFTFTSLRLLLLRNSQSKSFRQADGMIFLTGYASRCVQRITGALSNPVRVIPHGLNNRFVSPPKPQLAIEGYTDSNPYRLVYVSIVNLYKHQWKLVEAVNRLRLQHGWPLVLDLIGPAYPPALATLRNAMARWDPKGEWVRYHGNVSYNEVHEFYHRADLGVFASSCENMPNILLEMMAAGLPVACSNRGPMPEVLGDAGLYFDPENPSQIAKAIECMIRDPQQRAALVERSSRKSGEFSWERCADQTFSFLADVYRDWGDRQI